MMDASFEHDAELFQGWDFNSFDQGYSQMFGLPDVLNPLEHPQILFNDSLGMEDISFVLDCSFPGTDISSGFNSEMLYGFEIQDSAEVRCGSPRGAKSPVKSEPSVSAVQSATLFASRELKPRKLEAFLGEFETSRPTALERNHRRAYRPEKRKKVEQVRKAGACLRCRLLKRPCKVDLPCDGCLKNCGSISLGKALCGRQKLLEVRSATDLWERQKDLSWIKQEVRLTPIGPKRTVQLPFWDNCDVGMFLGSSQSLWDGGHDGPYIRPALIEIEVQEFLPDPERKYQHNLCVFRDGVPTVLAEGETSYYAIPDKSIPTLETLERWALESTRFKRRAIFGDNLQGSFMSLARRWYQCDSELPLADLMQKAVRLSCLHAIWCSALPEPRKTLEETPRYASKAVHKQIGAVLSQEIETLKRQILVELQGLIFHSKGPGKVNMLPIWICLWLLMLTYRRTVLNLSSERSDDKNTGLAQHMYEMLISIYSGLFRPSSPLWLNLLKDEVFQLFGRDYKVVERLGTVKTEVCYVLNSVNNDDFQSSHDTLLRTLVLDHERRLGRKAHANANLSRPIDGVTTHLSIRSLC